MANFSLVRNSLNHPFKQWLILLGLLLVSFFWFQRATPGNYYLYRYCLGLFFINSLLYLALFSVEPKMARILFGFMTTLLLTVVLYLALQTLSIRG